MKSAAAAKSTAFLHRVALGSPETLAPVEGRSPTAAHRSILVRRNAGWATSPLTPAWRLSAKRAADLAIAAALLLSCAPVMLLIALMIRLSDGGPALISHVRVGRGGVGFRCLKFRSMVVNADTVLARIMAEDPAMREEWARSRKLLRDPRVTRLGRVLRATSLDEIPQLINVLRGDMSLVGPRPVVAEELLQYYGDGEAAHYLAVRPGITGLWQVSGRSTRSYAERVALDVDYVRRLSLRRDVTILARTVFVVLTRRGAC